MEGSNYMMWMKRKQMFDEKNYCSWEERAFAEDAARILSGSIWPPRSYSCTFCKREFRSAQALGGHMNIHRRDRAKLKQNLSPHNDFNYSSLGNNHNHNHHCFSKAEVYSSQRDYSTITTTRTTTVSTNSEAKGECNNNFNDYVETRLSVGLSSDYYSVFGEKSSINVTKCGDEEGVMMRCKRVKSSSICCSSLPALFLKPCSSDNPAGMEELDLELRLGKHQKVN